MHNLVNRWLDIQGYTVLLFSAGLISIDLECKIHRYQKRTLNMSCALKQRKCDEKIIDIDKLHNGGSEQVFTWKLMQKIKML